MTIKFINEETHSVYRAISSTAITNNIDDRIGQVNMVTEKKLEETKVNIEKLTKFDNRNFKRYKWRSAIKKR